jgi:hypothetical protein
MMNATAAIGLACLALVSACPVQASDETYYIYHQHLAMMEREAALFSPVEEWVVRFLRDRIVADELPGEYSCSLYYGVDKWTAAEILLNLTLDDDIVRHVRSNPQLEDEFARVVRKLRPAIILHFALALESPSQSSRDRALWWADGLMRLYPHPREEPVQRLEWETKPRPWSAPCSSKTEASRYVGPWQVGNDPSIQEAYWRFLDACGINLTAAAPRCIIAAHINCWIPGPADSPDHWYYRGMSQSWLAGLFLGRFPYWKLTREYEVSIQGVDSGLDVLTNDRDAFNSFLVAVEYLRPAFPPRFVGNNHEFTDTDIRRLCQLDSLLYLYRCPDNRGVSQ